MKKSFIFFITIIFLLTSISFPARAEELMSDISGDEWFANDVRLLVKLGIINGFPDGTYRPDDTFKTDEFIKALVLALHYEPSPNNTDYWAQGYIDTAEAVHWLQYVKKTIKDYKDPITREQMGVILYSAVRDIPGVQMNGGRVNLMYKVSEYQRGIWIDSNTSVPGAYDMLIAIYGLGIITGYPDGEFGNKRNLTRSEAAAVLARIIDPSRRIYPDVGFTPPQKGKVEVEGVVFDYRTDLEKHELENRVDYYMSEEMQEYFALKHFESFQISKDGTVKFYMPELPDGFDVDHAVTVYYKDGVIGETIDSMWNKQILFGTSGNIPSLEQGKWHEYKAEKNFDYIEYIKLMYIIQYEEYYGDSSGYNFSFFYEFPRNDFIIFNEYYENKELKPVTWEVKFSE